MSYQFPRRVLRQQDVLDPIELTQDISPAAERLSGRLNAHNFNTTMPAATIAASAFYKPYYASVTADPQLGGGGSVYHVPVFPGSPGADPNAYRVTNTFEWQSIDDQNGTPISVTLTCGVSVLWVNAFVQYMWAGFNAGVSVFGSPWGHDYAGPSARPCNVQFAIRVDGSVIDDTITGVDQLDFRSSMGLKARIQRSSSTLLPGPQDVRGNVASSLGPPSLPVRLTLCLPVQAGNHTVEIVVRRMPDVRDVDVDLAYTSGDFVAVFNRQLLVVDLKSFPVDSVVGAEVSAPGWDEEDPITTASIYTQRVQPIISGYNNVDVGNVQRGALMHYHLPSSLIHADTAEQEWAAAENFNNAYPGFTSATVTTTKFAGLPGIGWYLLDDGVAPTYPVKTGPFDATKKSFFVVLANAQLIRVGNTSLDTLALGMQNQFAAFRIMYKLVGDPNLHSFDQSTGFINSFVSFTRSGGSFNTDQATERAEVQLMACLDLRSAALAAQIEYFALYGSAITVPSVGVHLGHFSFYTVRRASIVALQMRP